MAILEKLERIPLERIEEAIQKEDNRQTLETLILCRHVKRIQEQKPEKYRDMVEWFLLYYLFSKALDNWEEALRKQGIQLEAILLPDEAQIIKKEVYYAIKSKH